MIGGNPVHGDWPRSRHVVGQALGHLSTQAGFVLLGRDSELELGGVELRAPASFEDERLPPLGESWLLMKVAPQKTFRREQTLRTFGLQGKPMKIN